MIEGMLFAEALETQKCLDEGVLTSTADANIGSIMGIGFPPYTGGSAQFIVGYQGAHGIGKESVRRAGQGVGRPLRRPFPAAGLADLSSYPRKPLESNGSGLSRFGR
jgi:3-hydroxyacyl-CoA dehydrogenase / enoyl-CoA hydratase / 3-hydroxybutyryl-CoA epimerase